MTHNFIKQLFIILLVGIWGQQFSYAQQSNNLADYYPTDKESVDYIFVVDMSGSMRTYWPHVKESIIKVIEVLPDGDYVSILGFDASCSQIIIPRKITNTSKQQLIKEVNLINRPSGAYTDLWESTDKVLDEINRPESNRINFVYYFTDFINDPPNDTKWKNTDETRLIKQKYTNFIDNNKKLIKLYAIQLPLSNKAGKDYSDFSKLFGYNAQRIFLDKNSLNDWFSRNKSELRREKQKLIITDDIQVPILVNDITVEDNIINLRRNSKMCLKFHYPYKMPAEIINVILHTKEKAYTINIKDSISNPNNDIYSLCINYSDLFFIEKTFLPTNKEIALDSLSITYTFPFNELNELNINRTRTTTQSTNQEFILTYGLSILYLTIFIAALVILILIYLRCLLKPEYLFKGQSINYSIEINNKQISSDKIEKLKTTKILSSNTLTDIDNINPFKLIFTPKRGCLNNRRGTYISCETIEDFHIKIDGYDDTTDIAIPSDGYKLPDFISSFSIHTKYYLNGREIKININFF